MIRPVFSESSDLTKARRTGGVHATLSPAPTSTAWPKDSALPADARQGPARCATEAGVPSLQDPIGYRCAKRTMDIVGSVLALLVLSPLMFACAVAIKWSDGGPVLFAQTRVGKGGRHFRILKLRTMVVGAERMKEHLVADNLHPDARTFKILHDPRITPLGRFLRRCSLDEIPQFINVLRGDMSLVGPRPALPSEVALYESAHLARLSVKPGITCIWQVSGRSRLAFDRQLQLDLNYITRRSVALDLKLLLVTLPAVIRGDGAA